MKKYLSKLKRNAVETAVNPIGLTALTLNIEPENAYFRKKINGDLTFKGEDFKLIEDLQQSCCEVLGFDIFRNCNQTIPFIPATLNAQKIDWNNELKQAKLSPDLTDVYNSVFRKWEDKINILELTANRTLRHLSRKVIASETENAEVAKIVAAGGTVVNIRTISPSEKWIWFKINNNRGRAFVDAIFHIVKKTFQNTEVSYIVPPNAETLSYFLTSENNICTGRKNIFKAAAIFQGYDISDPTSTENSTALMKDGKLNENMAMSLKDILSELKTIADTDWFIDPQTGFFRIEHSSFFERGGSYTQDVIGLDLTPEKYAKYFEGYLYSFKNDTTGLAQIDEIKFTLNEPFSSSQYARNFPRGVTYDPTLGYDPYQYLRVLDFNYGNIKYNNSCTVIGENGEIKRNTLTSQFFITQFEAVEFNDDNLDKSKWVLVEIKEIPPDNPDIGVIAGNEIYEVVRDYTELLRINEPIKNANFSGTALMRMFHRWGRSYPIGNMNYQEDGIAGTTAQTGYTKQMYSTKRTLVLKPFKVPLCCDDATFYPSRLVKLPNNLTYRTKSGKFELGSEMLELTLSGYSNCLDGITYPPVNNDPCETAGTLLRVERFIDTCYVYDGDPCEQDDRIRNYWGYIQINRKRYVYADGYCREYNEEVPCPTSSIYYERTNTTNRITAQAWTDLEENVRNNYEPLTTCL